MMAEKILLAMSLLLPLILAQLETSTSAQLDSTDAEHIYYKPGDDVIMECPTPPGQWPVEWSTCTDCIRPYPLTGNIHMVPYTEFEIISSDINAKKLKLEVKGEQLATTTLICRVKGQPNILKIFHLIMDRTIPSSGGYVSNSAPQEAPLIDNKQLILSCRAACFQPGTCSYQWLKNGQSLNINGLELAVTETGSYACTDRNNDVVMPFSVTSSDTDQEPIGEQFFKYENVTTTTTNTTAIPTNISTTPPVEEVTSATIEPSANKVSAPATRGTGRIVKDPIVQDPTPSMKDSTPTVQDPNPRVDEPEQRQDSSSGSASSNKPGISSGSIKVILCVTISLLAAMIVVVILLLRRRRNANNPSDIESRDCPTPEDSEAISLTDT